MRQEITQSQAQIICGQIRQRKRPVALFATKTGIEIKQIGKCSDKEIGRKDFIGTYDKRVDYRTILEDWNDSI